MKIETKLSINNMRKNIKRTIFTTISIILCTFLILTTMFVISSIRNGITENIATEDNDYHFVIKDLDIESLDEIRYKEYIDKIYTQENNVYIKYNNVKRTCKYTTDIVQTLNLSYDDAKEKCEFNEKLLTVYGLIDVEFSYEGSAPPICQARLNFSYVLDIMILVILLVFSILFIIILYNAFLITINERKKEYAILNSVGGTEGQILKMIFLEATIMGIVGIIIGSLISFLGTNIILKMINNLLVSTGYNFCLIIDIKYMVLSLFMIIFNIYISAIIPSVKASSTSVIQNIRNNKQIKHKKNAILEKILPIEGKLALKNLKRNKNKYRVITILLVICMTSFITVSTYINYEKEAADIVNEYDVDAELTFYSDSNIDYKSILDNYMVESGKEIEYMEYKIMGPFVLVEPEDALTADDLVVTYKDNKKSTSIILIGLDDKTYNNYINKLNANYGDNIIYNMAMKSEGVDELVYTYYAVFEENCNLNLSVISEIYYYENNEFEYEIIDDENLNSNLILTDELIEGYKDIKNNNFYTCTPTVFTNMDTYNKIAENLDNYTSQDNRGISKWMWNDKAAIHVKVKCENIIEFSNYIEDIIEKQNIEIGTDYYSLDNQEKIIYTNILQLILGIIMIAVIVIGITSAINIMNASLCEREQEFKILSSLGATKEDINKILIYECIYMFIKATIISIILSIPILDIIIEHMKNVIILNKILIPFGGISLFFILLFIISLIITLYSTSFVKDE